ncbi:hypothetical protein KEM09_00345 [Carboxylicivirga mesophila]|uniref:Tail specific protease domain-containing protein n=1 Tax=Carboxylicivirga mesophila TaxID=1166478 RepID=A0ABS5K4E6_9BACT|nr:S41 family peptidase [Carboxylicivirga mesophila]MBS2209832.1 hypothetical protein [Carboxylicivirga mesophila]
MRKVLIFQLFIIVSNIGFTQTKYDSIFDETVNFVEENYAGYQDKTTNKNDFYNYLLQTIRQDPINSSNDLRNNLDRYLAFFEDRHLKLNDFDLAEFIASGKNNQYKSSEFKFDILNESTCYLKIPHFLSSSLVEKLINENISSISRKRNLIIDIRGNGGGNDNSYHKLLQIIATNDIYLRNAKFLKTKANWEEKYGKWDKTNEGKFVNLPWNKNKSEIFKSFTISGINEYPKRVAILVDRNVKSSGEMFVLSAKQSLKVKIFGENTAGLIDYSNVNQHEILEDSLYLQYPMTKIIGIPINSIDNHGIVPDFYLMDADQIGQILKYFEIWN